VKADVAGSRGMVFVARLKINRIVGFFQKWVLSYELSSQGGNIGSERVAAQSDQRILQPQRRLDNQINVLLTLCTL
jgi:hypothetical protein